MKNYLRGILNQQQAKIDRLFVNIPMHGRITSPIEIPARERLSELSRRIENLKVDILSSSTMHPVFLRAYKIIKEEIDHVEAILITTLNRWNDIDKKINSLVDKIATEIAFPISPPVVACSSQRYFYTIPKYYIIYIPLTEGDFLLHLPDLYHELGHSLLAFSEDKKLESFQRAYLICNSKTRKFIKYELQKEERNRGPNTIKRYFINWHDSWHLWIEEMFCDLFSVATLGPAFVWSHLHLSISTGADPFDIPLFKTSTHPPNATRMQAMLYLLELLGFSKEIISIKKKWKDFLTLRNARPSPEYQRCFPDTLLSEIASCSQEGVMGLNCMLAHPKMSGACRNLLNEAWQKFWEAPEEYADWENNAVRNLMCSC